MADGGELDGALEKGKGNKGKGLFRYNKFGKMDTVAFSLLFGN
jgi:hypothetical protein